MNIILSGPAESGKTFIAESFAQLWGKTVSRVSTIGASRFFLSRLRNPGIGLLIVDGCSFEEIVELQFLHHQNTPYLPVVYCTRDAVASDLEGYHVIDLWHTRPLASIDLL